MYSKSFLKNIVLITALAVSTVILYAQISNKKPAAAIDGNTIQSGAVPDSIPEVDNSEGLAELDKIMQRYKDGNLYLTGEIVFYQDATAGQQPEEKISFVSVTVPGAISYEVDSVQTISAGNLMLMVDKKEKTMAIVERDPENLNPTPAKDMIGALEEFRGFIYSIQVSKVGNEKKLSIIFQEDSPANTNSYEVTYDPETYRVKKIRMEIADGQIVEGDETQNEDDELVLVDPANNELPTGYYVPDLKLNVYEVIYKTEKNADPSLIDIKKFVTKMDEGYQPAGNYKHYELLN
jgi:hypothetical protein